MLPENNGTKKSPINAITIDGLDIKKGSALSGGTTEYHDETLPWFYQYGMGVYEKINNCFDAGNLSVYITHINSLKNAAAYIGAVKLSEAAQTLESAVDLGDFSFIESTNKRFLITLKQLLCNINNALSSRDKKD